MKYITHYEADMILKDHKSAILNKIFGTNKSKVLCPFHSETIPSMQLYENPTRLEFYCFGKCHRKYSLPQVYFKMVYGTMPVSQADYKKAYNEIFEKIGINDYYVDVIFDKGDYENRLKQAVTEISDSVLTYELTKDAKNILANKGLMSTDITYKYGITMLKNNVDLNDIIKTVSNKYKISADIISDIFIPVQPNRIIYQYFDEHNNIIAFTSRAISDNDKIKYINSKNSPIFEKSKNLYMQHVASLQPALTNASAIIVVEGYNDAIAMHEAGYTNTVAACGTSITEQMIDKIINWGYKHIILCLDGDEAGYKSMYSALVNVIAPKKIQATVKLIGKDNKDIDELLSTNKRAFTDLPTVSPVEFIYKLSVRDSKIKNTVKYLIHYSIEEIEQYVQRTLIPENIKYIILYETIKQKYHIVKDEISALTKNLRGVVGV